MNHLVGIWKDLEISVLSEKPVPAVVRTIDNASWHPLFPALVSWKAFWRVCAEIWRADRILIGGGDVVRPEFLSMLPLLIALVLGKEVSLVGVGVVAPQKAVWRLIYKVALSCVTHALARDERSGEVLRRFSSASVCVGPDLVFAAANGVNARVAGSEERDSIVVNLRSVTNPAYLHHMNVERLDDAALCETLAQAISQHVLAHTTRVVLVPMVDDSTLADGYSPTESDLTILNRLRSVICADISVEVVSIRPHSIEQLNEIYQRAQVVIAMRLHAVIPALAWAIPVVAIPYASKVGDLRERFPSMHTISVNDLLNGETGQVAQIIESASGSVPDSARARALGVEASRSLDKTLSASDTTDMPRSRSLHIIKRLTSCLLVSAFALKTGFNRMSAHRQKYAEAA
ncbi:hypothetical protein HHL14_16490 [Paraburkholderia sp. G-4-1-8]|uniref:Polysaccharide pyruvyl transferase domain-containing protein n=1 Tax=Paraburkholderia antibiotica TaxID=2728839 RepID=A0A7X9X6J3_9BURK|nr:hypothetical protein [Paraburkholderia antibiotica]